MEQYTPLEPLTEIISTLPLEQQAPPLRTRALVQIFKHQWDGAALDLTAALRITEELKRLHKPNQQQLELASKMREEQDAWNRGHRDWRSVPQLKEEDQPKSLEMQLLFNRGGVYLTIACQAVHAALDGLKGYQVAQERGETNGVDAKAHAIRLDARKKVKTYAKRALKDYTAFLSHFDYTPGLPYEITNEIMRRVYDLANGNKTQTPLPKNRLVELNDSDDSDASSERFAQNESPSSSAIVKHEKPRNESFERGEDGWPRFPSPQIHAASVLFAEKPPSDVPAFPTEEIVQAMLNNDTLPSAFGSREAVTYHPLLTDALHSLLLAHSLLQTSPTELLRHAHNAARLARIADGYPIFQAARSPARADWIEVLRRANNWLGLAVPWQKLCAPAPLPEAAGGWAKYSSPNGLQKRKRDKNQETAEQKRERIKQESIIDALSDDRVVDEESFQKAVRARERRAMEDEEGLSGPLKDKDATSTSASTPTTPARESPSTETKPEDNTAPPQPKRWAQDENGREYPISTDRAEAIARWIKEAPLSMGGGKKKKRPAGKKRAAGAGEHANGMQSLASSVGDLRVEREELEEGPD